ncbi:uncharacterized protein LAJ45_05945 [Morchella importuna]|uniref:uncharacterized protein n=1 Tax=Morchella importuna TaxID=1174673 RepID=UPI001E8DC563|nr:uncharacterized protein LAJ45_05945 [Morchella importuna]KAH8149793.1 hypothetical protein LAJ45_05945 [Morchella importuna]
MSRLGRPRPPRSGSDGKWGEVLDRGSTTLTSLGGLCHRISLGCRTVSVEVNAKRRHGGLRTTQQEWRSYLCLKQYAGVSFSLSVNSIFGVVEVDCRLLMASSENYLDQPPLYLYSFKRKHLNTWRPDRLSQKNGLLVLMDICSAHASGECRRPHELAIDQACPACRQYLVYTLSSGGLCYLGRQSRR